MNDAKATLMAGAYALILSWPEPGEAAEEQLATPETHDKAKQGKEDGQ